MRALVEENTQFLHLLQMQLIKTRFVMGQVEIDDGRQLRFSQTWITSHPKLNLILCT